MTSVWLRLYRIWLASAILLASGQLLAGCSAPAPSPERSPETAAEAPAGFVNRVWRVERSSSVAPGQMYVFLSEGTLLIASSTGTPALGKWTYEGGAFTMVEEGIPYKVDILGLSPDEFRIRSNNPGEPVDITLVPAEAPPFSVK